MTIEFPAPAASEQPGFPVYDPTTTTPDGKHPMVPPADGRGILPTPETPHPGLQRDLPKTAAAATGPTFDSAKANPLGDYHKLKQEDPDDGRELLFTIGGVPLYAPREEDIDPAIGIRLIRDMRKFGVPFAVSNAMGELLGDDALDLLADAPRMSREEWAKIMSVLQDKVFSRVQDSMPGGKG